MYTYSAYQLIISSELLLPELCPIDDSMGKDQPPISIVFGHARRESVEQGGVKSLYYHIQPESCWFEIPNVTRFLIQHGRHIIVEPFPGVDDDSLRLFLYTICLPLVLIYHDFFLFHGGALHWGEEGVAFFANFGQGKSTLLASFLKDFQLQHRAPSFLSDDICVINQDGFLLPGFPYIQLREDVIKKMAIDQTKLKLIRPTLKKWFVPVEQAFSSQPSLLKIIYIINPGPRPDVLLTPLVGLKKIQYLRKYTFHPLFVKGLGKDRLYFKQCASLAACTSVTYVERAKQGFQWDDFAYLIKHDLQRKVLECQ